MGLFSTVLHVYRKSQGNVVGALAAELQQNFHISTIERIGFQGSNFQNVLNEKVYAHPGVFYLVTPPHGNWTTIIEVNVQLEEPFYLYELPNSLSKRLGTYCLSFHLHDDDVLFYNLEKDGVSLDGYNSDCQYFLTEPADRSEVLRQRHSPEHFNAVLPAGKKVEELNAILNEGYWGAFDNDDLDEEGVPDDEKYFIDEQDRFERIGKYLELYTDTEYPFASWLDNSNRLPLNESYLLKGSL